MIVNGSVTKRKPLASGVTQRSILGPILFDSFINDRLQTERALGKFALTGRWFEILKVFFTMSVLRHWSRLPRVVDAPSLEVPKVGLDGGLSNLL